MGRGASSILPILVYLEKISDIKRKVFVLLDGDDEGTRVYGQIKDREYRNLNIKKFLISNGREIEDMVFSKEDFTSSVLDIVSDIKSKEVEYRKIMSCVGDDESFIQQSEKFIDINRLDNVNIKFIKHQLSINLDDKSLNDTWILSELRDFFDESE